MLFKDYTYSVLIVSCIRKICCKYKSVCCRRTSFGPVKLVKSAGEARRRLADLDFDIVLINTPLADDFGTKLAHDVAVDTKSGVLMFVKADLYDEVTDQRN